MNEISLTTDEKLLILNRHLNGLVEGEIRFLQYLDSNPEIKDSEEMNQVKKDIETQYSLINNEINILLIQKDSE